MYSPECVEGVFSEVSVLDQAGVRSCGLRLK
jgi:hypothetical protein